MSFSSLFSLPCPIDGEVIERLDGQVAASQGQPTALTGGKKGNTNYTVNINEICKSWRLS